jgi:hypothetical protein
MRKYRTLDVLLPKTRQGILAATLIQPEKAWYVSELARRMGVPSVKPATGVGRPQ